MRRILNKILKITFTIIVIYGNSFGQNANQNLAKYWYYKDRLNKYFLVTGDGDGKSLPASTRNTYAKNAINDSPNDTYNDHIINGFPSLDAEWGRFS